MKDTHFNNCIDFVNSLLEKMEAMEDVGLRLYAFVQKKLVETAMHGLGDASTIVERDGKDSDLLVDEIDNYDYVINPEDAATVIERMRAVSRLAKRREALDLKTFELDKEGEDDSLMGALFRVAVRVDTAENSELQMSQALLDCYLESVGREFGEMEGIRAATLVMAKVLVNSRLDEIEGVAEKSEGDLDEELSEEFGDLLELLDQIRGELEGYLAAHPEFKDAVMNDESEDDEE